MADEDILKQYIANHAKYTGSKRAQEILDNWEVARTKFVKVFPNEYRKALVQQTENKEAQ